MLLPLTVSCFTKIQIGFIFLGLAYPGSPRKRAVKRVCVYMYVVVLWGAASLVKHCCVLLMVSSQINYQNGVD